MANKGTRKKRAARAAKGYTKLNDQHREFLRSYVTKVLTRKAHIYELYMDTYKWSPERRRGQAKKNQAAVLANRIINTAGADEYIKELQKEINDKVIEEQVIRPITEDLILLDKIILHNIEGFEKNSKDEMIPNLHKISKAHTAIRAIERKAAILGENRIRLVGSEEKVVMTKEAVNARLETLLGKAKKDEEK